jgi:hypothetical protein
MKRGKLERVRPFGKEQLRGHFRTQNIPGNISQRKIGKPPPHFDFKKLVLLGIQHRRKTYRGGNKSGMISNLREDLLRKLGGEDGVTIRIEQGEHRKTETLPHLGGNRVKRHLLLMSLRQRQRPHKEVEGLAFSGTLKHEFSIVIIVKQMRIQHRHGFSRGDFEIFGSHLVKSYLKNSKIVSPFFQGSGEQRRKRNIPLSRFVCQKKTIGMHIPPPSNTFSSF